MSDRRNGEQQELYSYVYPPLASEGVNPYRYLMVSRITKKVP